MKNRTSDSGFFYRAAISTIIVAGFLFSFTCANPKSAAPATKLQTASPVASTTAKTTVVPDAEKQPHTLIVYYFHGNFRCQSCATIEKLTRQAVTTGFADQLESGRIELKIVNVEETPNEHYSKDYKLYTKSVILSDVKNGKEASWKNLEQVWTKLNNENQFIDYIQSEIKTLL